MDSNSVLTNNQIYPGTFPAGNAQQGTSPIANSQTAVDLTAKLPANSGTIEASKLAGAKPVTVPAPAQNTVESFINSLQVGTPSSGLVSASDLKKNVDTAQTEVDQTTKDINDLLVKLGYKSADTARLQEEANITGLNKELADLNTQYAQKKAAYDAQFQRIGAQNIPTLFVTGQQAIARAAAASDLGATAAQIQAAQGNIQTAFNTIDRTISQKYQPITDQINQKLAFYELNKDKLTRAQSLLATRQADILGLQKEAISNQQKIIQDSIGVIKDAVGKVGLDTGAAFKAISDILGGVVTPSQALANLGLSVTPSTSSGNIADAISSVESSGAYDAVGRTLTSGENAGYAALGKYQIMPNIWFPIIGLDPKSEADKQKFLSTPALQDQLFETIITTLMNKYGDEAKAVAAYFGGDAAAKAYGTVDGDKITDGNMSVNQYVNKVLGNLKTSSGGAPGTTGKAEIDATVPGYATDIVPGTGNLTQASIDQRALSIALGNESAPKSGSGISGLNNRAINNRVGELNASGNIAANKATLKSLSATLTEQTKYAATISRSLDAADEGFKQVVDTFEAKGINNSSIPVANMISNAVKYQLTPGDISAFRAGLTEVANEYTQVFSRGGQATDAVRKKSDSITNGNLSINDLRKVMEELQAQGAIVEASTNKAVKDAQDKINNIISPAKVSTETPKTSDINAVKSKYGLEY